jgi:Acetyltransferases, including N-acetylases of ribosomal proteins
MVLTSNRLIFREFEVADYNYYCSIFSNEQVMKYAYYDCMRNNEELFRGFSEVIDLNKVKHNRREYDFAVFRKDDNIFIGTALILVSYRGDIPLNGEIGYFLIPDFWGMGYATEIANAMTGYCFEKLNLHRVIASCNVNNPNSEKIMKKIGMQKEGEFRKARFKDGHWDNELKYGILKEEWKHF